MNLQINLFVDLLLGILGNGQASYLFQIDKQDAERKQVYKLPTLPVQFYIHCNNKTNGNKQFLFRPSRQIRDRTVTNEFPCAVD